MGFSSLVSEVVLANKNNYSDRRGMKICKFTPHHMAGILTGKRCAELFQNPNRQASANYCIGNDGEIVGCVDEENRGWASANAINDRQAITVEVSNCEVGGQWKVSDKAWDSLVKLAYDVCKRYGFRLTYDGTPNGSLTHHNMFMATTCPGPYLQSRMKELTETVNKMLDGEEKFELRGTNDIYTDPTNYVGTDLPNNEPKPVVNTYKVGTTYTTQVDLKVRKGAGTDQTWKLTSQLTTDGKKHAYNQTYAVLKTGTRVTCQEIRQVGNDTWIKIPSGWIAAKYQGKIYVK